MIAVTKTFKESYTDVRGHLLPWVRVAFTPFIIYLIGVISMVIGFYLSGGVTLLIEQGAIQQTMEQTSASVGFLNVIYQILYMLAILVWYLNGFRYAALGEGGDKWWNLHLNVRLWKMFLYQLLVIVLFVGYGAVAAGITVGSYLLTESVFLTAFLGTFFGLGFFYLIGRLSLVFLNVATDKKDALMTSWHAMKGNVLRLIGLFILIWLAIIGLIIVGALMIGLSGALLGFISPMLGYLAFALAIPFMLFVWLVAAAMTMKAIALVDRQLTK
ncbi:MAG: hypothetical protein K2Y08_01345 [Alphaproteobacteria bacterium]|nr:hypothetical protein [Alphaproteobacteria bacterium]